MCCWPKIVCRVLFSPTIKINIILLFFSLFALYYKQHLTYTVGMAEIACRLLMLCQNSSNRTLSFGRPKVFRVWHSNVTLLSPIDWSPSSQDFEQNPLLDCKACWILQATWASRLLVVCRAQHSRALNITKSKTHVIQKKII